ncbi:unnamed protein product [Urochloa humidicola]
MPLRLFAPGNGTPLAMCHMGQFTASFGVYGAAAALAIRIGTSPFRRPHATPSVCRSAAVKRHVGALAPHPNHRAGEREGGRRSSEREGRRRAWGGTRRAPLLIHHATGSCSSSAMPTSRRAAILVAVAEAAETPLRRRPWPHVRARPGPRELRRPRHPRASSTRAAAGSAQGELEGEGADAEKAGARQRRAQTSSYSPVPLLYASSAPPGSSRAIAVLLVLAPAQWRRRPPRSGHRAR